MAPKASVSVKRTNSPNSTPLTGWTMSLGALLHRSEPLRCVLIGCLSVVVGWLLLPAWLPFLPQANLLHLLTNHIPGETTAPVSYWLRLCGARVPIWFFLTIAGFTRFSGGLTTAILGYRGLCDGMALRLLWEVCTGRTNLALPGGIPPLQVGVAYGIWLLLGLLIRLLLAVKARRMAKDLLRIFPVDGRMDPQSKELFWRYAAMCLGGLCAVLTSCGLYTAILYT